MRFHTTRYYKTPSVILFALFCVAAGLYSVGMGTDTMWDLKNYHLYVALAFFEDRLFYDVAPAQLQSYQPPFGDLYLYILFEYLNDWPRLFAFIQGIFAGIYGYLVFLVTRMVAASLVESQRAKWTYAALATALGLTGAGFTPLIGVATGDINVGVAVLASLALVLAWVERTPAGVWQLFFAGCFAGLALAIKLTAVMYCIPLGLIVVATRNFRGVIAFGFAAATVFLALWGPHGWKLWMEFGNPLFPLYNDIFRSPDWLPQRLTLYQRYLPSSALEYLFYPFVWAVPQRRVIELSTQDLRLSLLLIGLLVWLLVYLARSVWSRYGASWWQYRASVWQTIIDNRVSFAFLAFLVLSYFICLIVFG